MRALVDIEYLTEDDGDSQIKYHPNRLSVVSQPVKDSKQDNSYLSESQRDTRRESTVAI